MAAIRGRGSRLARISGTSQYSLLQYLNLHLTHRGASWASGAAQAAHVVRIIFVWFGAV